MIKIKPGRLSGKEAERLIKELCIKDVSHGRQDFHLITAESIECGVYVYLEDGTNVPNICIYLGQLLPVCDKFHILPAFFTQLEAEKTEILEQWVVNTQGDYVCLPTRKIDGYWYCQENGVWQPTKPLQIEEGTFKLVDGRFAIGKYGKYQPSLTFISVPPQVKWRKIDKQTLNVPQGDLYIVKGKYFVSKKGTKCFEVSEKGPHILVKDVWGGAFESYRGRTLPEEGALYYRRASSNGGGCGTDYAVYPADWKYSIDVNEL